MLLVTIKDQRPASLLSARSARALPRLLITVFVVGSVSARAQLPIARLSAIFPPGGKAGSTVEVSLTGTDLDDANRLLFSQTNIVAQPKPGATDQPPESNRFIVTIGADVPVGFYEARVIGRFGISNPRTFVVGDLPETTVVTTNHSPATATRTPLGTVVNSHTDTSAVDYFRFTAEKGRRVLIDCQTRDIDSRMQDVLLLTDTNGRELTRNRRGGLLDFTAPADGDYILQVHDITFRNGEDYFYRLTLGSKPHLDFIFPPSGLPGTRSPFTLYGRNLPGASPVKDFTIDGKPLEKLSVDLELPQDPSTQFNSIADLALPPAGVALDAMAYRLKSPEGISNPSLLSFATAPIVVEQEPNDKPEQAQRISVPSELVGQFYPAGDQDWVGFEAKKGEVYWIEVFSHRLGLPTDPFVLVQRVTRNDKGEEKATDVLELNDSDTNIGGSEFNSATRDPVGRFEVKDDGTYRLGIRDLFNRFESNPRLVYRLSLRKESPEFRLVALPHAPPPANKDTKEALLWTPLLRRGETMPIKVLAFRHDDFKGDIQLSVEGLPPHVTCAPSQIDSDKTSALLFLTAAAETHGWFGPIRVIGKAKAGDTELAREARAGSITWTVPDYNNEAVRSRLTSQFYLATSDAESAPISVQPTEPKVYQATVGGKLQIPLKIDRHGEFNENLKFKATGLAAFDSVKELDVDGKTNTATLEIDLSQIKLSAGTHRFELQAQTKGRYRNNPDAAKEADEAAKQADTLADELAAEEKKATEALAAAAKAADEATAQVKSVSEAEKPAAEAKVKSSADFKTAAEKSADEATAKAKQAGEKRAVLQKRATELGEKAKPRDVTLTVYSAPITIQVKDEEKK